MGELTLLRFSGIRDIRIIVICDGGRWRRSVSIHITRSRRSGGRGEGGCGSRWVRGGLGRVGDASVGIGHGLDIACARYGWTSGVDLQS